jgi:hypothetical protein
MSNSETSPNVALAGCLIAMSPPMMLFFGMIPADEFFLPAAILGAIGGAMFAPSRGQGALAGAIAAVGGSFSLLTVATQVDSLPKPLWLLAMGIGYIPGVIGYYMLGGKEHGAPDQPTP